MSYGRAKLPLLLERVGVRRIKSSSYIPLIPTFSLWRRGSRTCVDIYALWRGLLPYVRLLSGKPIQLLFQFLDGSFVIVFASKHLVNNFYGRAYIAEGF